MFAKRPNERWLIMSKQGGGQIEVEEKDTVLFNDNGVFVFHNDENKTTTFVPMAAIAWIRSYFPKADKSVDGSMRELETAPVDSLPMSPARRLSPPGAVVELEEGEHPSDWDTIE